MLGRSLPPGVAGSLGEEPHHPRVKAAAPVGPQLAGMVPAAALGVDRKIIGMAFNRGANLTGGEIERTYQPGCKGRGIDKTNFGHGSCPSKTSDRRIIQLGSTLLCRWSALEIHCRAAP